MSWKGQLTFSLSRAEEVVLVLLWRGTSKRLGCQSWASRGQNLVNGRDLSSNSPSGGTLGLISEVLKVGFYGVCHVLRSFCFTCFFHHTEANCNDNRKVSICFCIFQFWIYWERYTSVEKLPIATYDVTEHWWILIFKNNRNIVKSQAYIPNIKCKFIVYSLSNLEMMSQRDTLSRNTGGSNSSSL